MPRRHRDEKLVIKNKIRRLIPRLKGKDASVLIETIKSLGAFGKDAAWIAEKLIPFVEHEDDTVRSYAMHALADISRESSKTAELIRTTLLASKISYVRSRACWILERVEGPTK